MWCSKIANIPGLYHGNNEMLGKPFYDVCRPETMQPIDSKFITELGYFLDGKVKKERWDFVNYSIPVDVVANEFERKMSDFC
jgi:hypothetical protein